MNASSAERDAAIEEDVCLYNEQFYVILLIEKLMTSLLIKLKYF